MREFKVGDKVSFEWNTGGDRTDGIVVEDNGDSTHPLVVKPIDPEAIGWCKGDQITYTRDGRWRGGDVELILTEPEAQNTVDMKNGDRVIVEFEVRAFKGDPYPYRLHFVLDDGSVRENAALELTADGKYLDDYPSPVRLTIIERGFQAGDRVECPLFGEGIVVLVDEDNENVYPVTVDFGNKHSKSYTLDGRYDVDAVPTLERLEESV